MTFTIEDDHLTIRLSFWEKLWGCKFQPFIIPLAHITRVHSDAPKTSWKELRAPGTFIPFLIKAGTYYTKRGKEFWWVTRQRTPIVLEIGREKYKRLVLGVKNPEQEKARIEKGIGTRLTKKL